MRNDYAIPKVPEYNIKGDSANGLAGSQTPGAIRNQVTQSSPGGSSSNPYAEILRFLPPIAAMRGRPSAPATGASAPPYSPGVSTPPVAPGTSTPPTYGGDGGTSMPPYNPGRSMPPVGPGGATPPSGPVIPPEAMPGIPGATPVPSLPTPPNENGDSLMAYSTQTTTPIGDNGSGPDTQRNVGDPPGLNPPPLSNGGGGGTGTTFAPGPTIEDPVTTPDPTPNPNGVPSWWGKEQGYEYLTGKEHLWGMYQRDAAEMAKRGHTNVDFVDWLASMGLVSPKAGRAGYDTFRNFAPGVPDNGGAPGNSAGAPPTPTAVDPRTYLDANDPRLQPQTAGGGSTSTSTTTAGNGGAGGDTGYAGILSQLQQLMNPQFNFESDQLNRHMNAQAALTGDFASGGYGEVNGRANAQLAADQGNRVSGMLNTDWQNELDRILKQYGIDIGSADSRYGADAGVKAAGIGAGASRYATDQRNNEANNSYNLGLAGLGLDKYKFDNPDINRLLGYYMQMSPEQLAQFATGTPNFFPTFGYNQHP